MQRIGHVLRIRQGKEEEYDRYHAAVWPEMLEALRDSGIRNYSIFRYHQWLFSYFELPDDLSLAEVMSAYADRDVCQRWEKIMRTLQEPLPESEPEAWWVPIPKVFYEPGMTDRPESSTK